MDASTERIHLPNIDGRNNYNNLLGLTINRAGLKTLSNSNSLSDLGTITNRTGRNVRNTIESLELMPELNEVVKNKVIKTENIIKQARKIQRYGGGEERSSSVDPVVKHSAEILRNRNWGSDSVERVSVDSVSRTPRKSDYKDVIKKIGKL
jgi:hypothetical protein